MTGATGKRSIWGGKLKREAEATPARYLWVFGFHTCGCLCTCARTCTHTHNSCQVPTSTLGSSQCLKAIGLGRSESVFPTLDLQPNPTLGLPSPLPSCPGCPGSQEDLQCADGKPKAQGLRPGPRSLSSQQSRTRIPRTQTLKTLRQGPCQQERKREKTG